MPFFFVYIHLYLRLFYIFICNFFDPLMCMKSWGFHGTNHSSLLSMKPGKNCFSFTLWSQTTSRLLALLTIVHWHLLSAKELLSKFFCFLFSPPSYFSNYFLKVHSLNWIFFFYRAENRNKGANTTSSRFLLPFKWPRLCHSKGSLILD